MSSRRRQTLSPTLFPFLAVLVCTLGTLILLLALVAQNTSEAAQQIAETQAAEPVADPNALTVRDVQDLVEEEEFRLGELISFREAQTGDLEDRRNKLAHVEDHIRRIRQRLKEVSDAMDLAMSDQPAAAATAEEVKLLREQLDKEELVVKKLHEEIKTEKPRFVIVPHQGPNGTNRRPIYLECTSKGVMIWPEGVEITSWQLEHSSAQANPLDDALRAARYHAMQNYGDTIPPYPMLIVRPAGVETYYAARAAMLDWDDQFGYELVPSDIELAYPQPDPEMRQRMEYAVNEAVNRVTQQSIARSIGGGGRGTRRPGVAGSRGNFARQAGVAGTSPGGTAMAPTGPSHVAGVTSAGNRAFGNQAPAGQAPGRPKPVPRLSVSQMDRQGRQSGFKDHRSYAGRSYGGDRSFSSGQPITSEAAKRRLERQLQDSASSTVSADSERALDQVAATALDEIAGGSAEATSGQAGRTESKSTLLMPPLNSGGDSDDAQFAQGNLDSGERGQSGRQPNNQTKNAPGALGSAGGAMTSANPQGQPKVSQRMKANAQQDAASNGGQPRSSQQAQSKQRSQSNQRAPSNRSPKVQRGGVDWALPSSVALGRGNEIVRSIRVQVHSDRLVLLPRSGMYGAETFLIQPSGVNEATLEMATAIRERVQRWGAAAPGARWSPRLKVEVMTGAEQRFGQLEQLMSGSGLPIERSGYSQAEKNQRENLR